MQVQKSSIVIGSRVVGHVWGDAGSVKGEGGPRRPEIVVPLTVAMDNSPEDAMLALVWLRASLSTSDNPLPQSMVSTPATQVLINNFQMRSLPRGGSESVIYLRFGLTAEEIEWLESTRHAAGGDVFTLYLAVEAVVGALTTYNEVRVGVQPEVTPYDLNYGLFSEIRPFWNTRVDLVRVAIEQSTWVRHVLPGLGHDRRRLIELNFPPPLPDHMSAAKEWDKARLAFDGHRYEDCVSECRDLLSMWKTQLGATKDKPVAAVIAEREGWEAADARIAFLAGMWKSATDLANAPHHPEGMSHEQGFGPKDARLMLLLTAALSEYVAEG